MSFISSDLSLFIQNDGKIVVDDPHAELEGQKLWKEFSDNGTEMVITKKGRRMFPTIRTKLTGLDKRSKYIVMLEMVQSDPFRYKFCNGTWKIAGKGDLQPIRAPIVHPDSPQFGEHWMKNGAAFKCLKLSNDSMNADGHIFLNSMHRYYPRFHIVRCDCYGKAIISTFKSFVFKHTDFIAVTAYQNDEVTAKKIANNPFAKGFRKDKHNKPGSRRSRLVKMQQTIETNSEDEELLPGQLNPSIAVSSSPSLQMFAQWQMAMINSFGSSIFPPTPPPLKIETEKIEDVPVVKKTGFGVMDLLGTP